MWLVEIRSIFILTYTRLPLPSYLSWHLTHRFLYYYIDLWYSLANKPPSFILSSTSPVYLSLDSSFLISGPASPDLSTTSFVSIYLFSWFLLDVCSNFVYLQASTFHIIWCTNILISQKFIFLFQPRRKMPRRRHVEVWRGLHALRNRSSFWYSKYFEGFWRSEPNRNSFWTARPSCFWEGFQSL